jgi:deazaflavin-dependent oxidoreductase (nitroreductase family)
VANTIMSAFVGAGLVPRSYLLTTQGRKTGRPRTNPVVPVEHDGRRWLVAPYGPVSWVHNARAAGKVRLARRRHTGDYAIREAAPGEAGPVLKRYVRLAPSTQPYFQASKDSPVEDFAAEADRHPVFELIPAGDDHQPGHRSHRPSAATVISLVALVFAMGGTAVAATGGNFILGKANTATSVSSLTNTKGTALKLSSTATTPPLAVSNSVQVPNLNASELDGHTSGAFLPATGTAANSSALGGTPASGYMQGSGDTTGARLTVTGTSSTDLLSSPGATLIANCDVVSAGSGPELVIGSNSGTAAGATALWWNKDGAASNTSLVRVPSAVTPFGSTTPYVVVVQVDNLTSVSTFTASEWYDSGSDTCHFTAQVVTTNG